MHNEQISNAWWVYLKNMFKHGIGDMPFLFETPHCGTCSNWFLIDEDGLDHIALTSAPGEYDEIIRDLKGERICDYREEGKIIDTYSDHRFYGWCKRFPPVPQSGHSIIGFRSFFSLLSRHIPKKVSEYDFPLMQHDNICGEWKKAKWVDKFIDQNRRKAQPDNAADA